MRPYAFDEGKIVVQEMADQLAVDLVRKGMMTDQVVLDVGYDTSNLTDPKIATQYKGTVKTDRYGRQVPQRVHGSKKLGRYMSSSRRIIEAVSEIYDSIVDRNLTARRFNVVVARLLTIQEAKKLEDNAPPEQMSLFRDYEAEEAAKKKEDAELDKERRMQEALISIRNACERRRRSVCIRCLDSSNRSKKIRNAVAITHKKESHGIFLLRLAHFCTICYNYS